MRNFSSNPICSVIIPAYNEADTIATTLRSLLRGMRENEFDVIVVCNGCIDNTAEVARMVAPQAHVLDLQVASKTSALNTGLAVAKNAPVVFLDADIKTDAEAVRSLVQFIHDEKVGLVYGNAYFNTEHCSMPVRAFYKTWQQNPYFDRRKMGGFFAVSAEGLNRLGQLPETTNDDEYVRRKLADQSAFVEVAPYVVEAPRTLENLTKVRSRVYRGNSELSGVGAELCKTAKWQNTSLFIKRIAARPDLWAGALIFASVAVIAHFRNLVSGHKNKSWEQDRSTRASALESR